MEKRRKPAVSVLDEILARKRADVAKRMEDLPYDRLRATTEATRRRFGAALKKPGARFILECKKASPSEGLIRKNFDAAEIAGAYKNFADALSVLTDEPYFQGSFEILRSIREIADQPILAKDFVIGPYQICEARFHGADAALLILSALDDETYKACAKEAERLSMDVLTEVHDEAELDRALKLNARILGVNNRSLKTLQVDLDVYRRLADRIPPGKIVVCESGIGSREDVASLEGRADAYLVGGMLMKSERIDLAVRRLIYGGVKICGLTSPEDAAKSYEAGAVFGGLIFADESPRRVDELRAREIRSASPLPMVGVFVNQETRKIARIASEMPLAAVQLHGEESGEFVEGLRKELPPNCEIWKAARVWDKMPPAGADSDRLLLDAYGTGSRGGTGRSFDWSLLGGFQEKMRRSKIILAGGIDAGNARRAAASGCFAIDVNSGVEASPGKKDHRKVEQLFANLRGGA
ncbi:MAG: bifunctional indole-3-glycerol-phosphate synthase TrpC/phosphoribosylanthranilate isomerase TrpF [Synergistaceae bacterium]|nr:bifunctional indole-3-glycerol-phosphate synthase TrpC/phosphoribosylanthranilate isomerase TrpF [Synergistaceae bacterium]